MTTSLPIKTCLHFFILCMAVGAGAYAHARDMAARLGIGYSDQSQVSIPSLRVKYYPSNDLAVAASLGSDTEKGMSRFAASGRVYRNIFHEEHLIFYGGAGGGLLSVETGSRTETGFELSGFFGVEFFIPGVESLGISFDAGLAVASLSNGVRFRTVADHPLRAGMVFYF